MAEATDPVLTGLLANLDSLLWDALGVIADRLEDAGQTERAAAYRFLAAEKLAPLRHKGRWHWRARHDVLPLGHQLPESATQAMQRLPDRIGLTWNEAWTIHEAYERAVDAILLADRLAIEEENRQQSQDPTDHQNAFEESEGDYEEDMAELFDQLPF